MAFGAATSLYERHPISGETAGNPVADVLQNTPYISLYILLYSEIEFCRLLLLWRELIAPYFVWRTELTGANERLLLPGVPSTEQWTT